jgi:predicted CopG family antitoxin
MKKTNTMMRVKREILEELEKCKLSKGESYADVVKRLIDTERRKRK